MLAASGCGSVGGPGGQPSQPSVRLARPLEVYRDLELITGSADFPAVATVATLAGPADSTRVLVGISLPAHVLRFQREDAGFAASYVVSLRAERDSQTVRVHRQETVRVPDFAETSRTDETVLFQTTMVLAPGVYALTVRVRDGLSARGFESTDTVAVPAYGTGGQVAGTALAELAPPVPVYRASARADRAAEPALVLNPRHTASYGGREPRVYVEAYGHDTVGVEVEDDRHGVVWRQDVALQAGAGLRAAVVTLPVDSLPMGRFRLRTSAGGASGPAVPFLVTLSDQWLVANFRDVTGLLRYIATHEEMAALRDAPPAERHRLWTDFWAARDPIPATPVNEYRDAFFERIRVASVQFAEPGLSGWRTDRGEVYIVLGPPSRLMEHGHDAGRTAERTRAEEWVYRRTPIGRLRLVFVDINGFGVYRLTQSSEVQFRAAARQLKYVDHR